MLLPRGPRPKLPESPLKAVRELVQEGHQQIEKARDGIRSVADDIRGATAQPPTQKTPPSSAEETIEQGTACLVCSDEHFSEVSGSLNEAMRFARNEAFDHPEVLKRIRHCRDELNVMERFDLSPQQIMGLPEIEKPIARWAVEQSRELRHNLNLMKNSDDLEKTAALASDVADDFEKKTMELKKHYEEETQSTATTALREWLEKREKEKKNAK